METITDQKLKIAIQGFEGSFHQEAAKRYYGQSIDIVAAASFDQLVTNILDPHQCDEGIMAIENSIAGSILPNYQLLEKAGLNIVGEVYLKIEQHLMATPGTTISSIKEVHSHPMAILQCKDFFNEHETIKLVETEDTALSAQYVAMQNDNTMAAIASKTAAQLYGLEIIASNIETVSNNYTRFLILSRHTASVENASKASLSFTLKHQPGSLATVMQVIACHDVNISKIQSIPHVVKEWEYSFHLDIEFEHLTQFNNTLKELSNITQALNILGVYKNGRK